MLYVCHWWKLLWFCCYLQLREFVKDLIFYKNEPIFYSLRRKISLKSIILNYWEKYWKISDFMHGPKRNFAKIRTVYKPPREFCQCQAEPTSFLHGRLGTYVPIIKGGRKEGTQLMDKQGCLYFYLYLLLSDKKSSLNNLHLIKKSRGIISGLDSVWFSWHGCLLDHESSTVTKSCVGRSHVNKALDLFVTL